MSRDQAKHFDLVLTRLSFSIIMLAADHWRNAMASQPGVLCVQHHRPDLGQVCDYSQLVASYGASSVSIARGASEQIGPWTVTNIRSVYLHGGESAWFRAVTLLGPGDTDEVDAGCV